MTTPGYIVPVSSVPLPKGLNLTQFVQTVITGVSGIRGEMVRAKWQTEPPKDPDIDVKWISFGIEIATPDANGYLAVNPDQSVESQRHEDLEITCDVYGTDALETCGIIRDGFQIPQNRYALFNANMAFVSISRALRVPELVNERFVNRRHMTIYMRRKVVRIYPIQTLISVGGVIHTVTGNEQYLIPFQTLVP